MTGSEPWRSPAEDAEQVRRICKLNDQFRSTFLGGRVVLTPCIVNCSEVSLPSLLKRIRQFDNFDASNDPYGEHDFGSLEWEGENVFWKIDYYDSDLLGGSPDPSDPAVTARVLTVMLASEY